MRRGVWLLGLLLVAGCADRRRGEGSGRAPSEPAPSTGRTVVEHVTGKAQVEAGRQAAKQIRAIAKEEQDTLDEVLGE